MLWLCIGSQFVLNLLKQVFFAFTHGPSLNLLEIDLIFLGNQDCLIKTLIIIVIVKPGQSVFHTISGRYNLENAGSFTPVSRSILASPPRGSRGASAPRATTEGNSVAPAVHAALAA